MHHAHIATFMGMAHVGSIAMSQTKRANGIDVKAYDCDDSTDWSDIRTVASLLPRGCDAVDRIVTGIGDDMANVWLADGASESVEIPDPLRVKGAFVAGNGSVSLKIVRDE